MYLLWCITVIHIYVCTIILYPMVISCEPLLCEFLLIFIHLNRNAFSKHFSLFFQVGSPRINCDMGRQKMVSSMKSFLFPLAIINDGPLVLINDGPLVLINDGPLVYMINHAQQSSMRPLCLCIIYVSPTLKTSIYTLGHIIQCFNIL